MAEISFKEASARIIFDDGFNDEGQPIRKSKMYKNISESATAENLLAGLTALGSLSTRPIVNIEKVETGFVHD